MSKRKGIREIPWGFNDNITKTCIYDNGHLDKEKFLTYIKLNASRLNTPMDTLFKLTVDDVQHLRFHAMSPGEAKAWGGDWGVKDCTKEGRGYPVTAVIL